MVYTDANGTVQVYPANWINVRAGSTSRLTRGKIHNIVQIVVHESFGNFLNDVSVMLVQTPFSWTDRTLPIALPTKNTPGGVNVTISGWGRLYTGGPMPFNLKWNTLKSLTLDECESSIGWGKESLLCLSHKVDNGACNGDSGGPALYDNELVGVAGFVVDGCDSNYPDGYARVYYHIDWIKKHTDL
ncbi:serine protease SP24D-like [Drosophila montana]|uniref:serine protease SP24D-like n=1 Tax=Drosophila montana TaxID=40370 RepID=UPI00313E8EC4